MIRRASPLKWYTSWLISLSVTFIVFKQDLQNSTLKNTKTNICQDKSYVLPNTYHRYSVWDIDNVVLCSVKETESIHYLWFKSYDQFTHNCKLKWRVEFLKSRMLSFPDLKFNSKIHRYVGHVINISVFNHLSCIAKCGMFYLALRANNLCEWGKTKGEVNTSWRRMLLSVYHSVTKTRIEKRHWHTISNGKNIVHFILKWINYIKSLRTQV